MAELPDKNKEFVKHLVGFLNVYRDFIRTTLEYDAQQRLTHVRFAHGPVTVIIGVDYEVLNDG